MKLEATACELHTVSRKIHHDWIVLCRATTSYGSGFWLVQIAACLSASLRLW